MKGISTKKIIILASLILILLTITSCTKTVDEITTDDEYVGETVRVAGTVESSIKLGELSGYTLVDKNNDKIIVSTNNLPDDGDRVIAKGTLKQGPLGIGHYIDAK